MKPLTHTLTLPQFTKMSLSTSLIKPQFTPKPKSKSNPTIIKTKHMKQNIKLNPKVVAVGAASVSAVVFLMCFDDHSKALALGPEGPLVEEFWENVRRYGLYALTVSTGALYTIFQPIFELLKNPLSAVLLLVIFGGAFFVVSQVLSAMVGVSDFSYDYQY